jgi:hypothetical protein
MSGPSDDAWEEYLMTGRPEALARFVELGGEIDDGVRELISAHLRGERPIKYANRSDHWRDYEVYSEVQLVITSTGFGVMEACEKFVLDRGKFTRDDNNFAEEVHKIYQQAQRGELAGQKGGPVYDAGKPKTE